MSDSSKDDSGLFPINRVDNNIHYTAQEYGLSPSGYFGEKGKKGSANWIRQIFCNNPIAEAARFYDLLSEGGKEKTMPNGHGVMTIMPDGSMISIRIITSSVGSPAVELKLNGVHQGVKSKQKIHFVQGGSSK